MHFRTLELEKFFLKMELSVLEKNIMQDWSGNLKKTVVSIVCATYNHEKYISKAIDGFLMQKTNFPFEILLGEDCSIDKTRNIILDYQKKFPNIIKPIYWERNVGASRNWGTLLDTAEGKYIANCEGDDYWTDPMKLQKQVNLLDKHPETVMSVAYTDVYEHKKNNLKYIKTYHGNDKILQGFEEVKKYYFHTSTYVIRADVLKKVINTLSLENIVPYDSTLRYMLITYGPFALLPEVVSIYRVTGDGIWTSLNETKQYELHESLYLGLHRIQKGKYRQFQGTALFSLYCRELLRRKSFGEILSSVKLLPKVLFFGAFYQVPSVIIKLFSWSKSLFGKVKST